MMSDTEFDAWLEDIRAVKKPAGEAGHMHRLSEGAAATGLLSRGALCLRLYCCWTVVPCSVVVPQSSGYPS
jgi:hypothetical protein